MNFFMVTLGTRGDLDPFMILGSELRERGHRVVMGTSAFYETTVRKGGMEWTQVGTGTYEQLLEVINAFGEIPDRTWRVDHYASRWLVPQFEMSEDHVRSQAEDADYFINNLKLTWPRGNGVIPAAWLYFDPDEIPLGLVERTPVEVLNLCVTNKQLVDPQNQVMEQFRFTGFWLPTRPTTLEPSPELVAFLEAGPPPVVFTLGSMILPDPQRVATAISEALKLTRQRGVIVMGWSETLRSAPWSGSVLCVNAAPYDWLFPRAACVIHHGGPGTFSYVLRAGKVSVVLPQTHGQEVSGWALDRHGLATACLEISSLQPQELADAIHRAVTEEKFQHTARAWRKIIMADPGVRGAADLIEEHWRTLQSRLALAQSPAPAVARRREDGKAKLLFLLSKDFGELHNAVYLATQHEGESLILAPPSLYHVQRDGLPASIAPYQSLQDVFAVVDQFQPDIVFLFSGYLYANNGIFSNKDLEKLVRTLRQSHRQVVTSDSFFGLLAHMDDTTFQWPPHVKELRNDQFAQAYAILKSVPHLYDTDPRGTTPTEAVPFSNVGMIRPPAYVPCPPEVYQTFGLDPARPRWVFVLATEDYTMLRNKEGLSFDELLTDQLYEALDQGRQAVLVAPVQCTSAVALRGTPDGLVLLPFCRHGWFLSLILEAEYVFYWNIFSNSLAARVVNQLPAFFFHRGHMAQFCKPLYERYLQCYFTAGCPLILPMNEPLEAEELPRLAAEQAPYLKALADSLLNSPAPAEVVRQLLRRPV